MVRVLTAEDAGCGFDPQSRNKDPTSCMLAPPKRTTGLDCAAIWRFDGCLPASLSSFGETHTFPVVSMNALGKRNKC